MEKLQTTQLTSDKGHISADSWLLYMHQHYPDIDVETLRRAVLFAQSKGKGVKTPTGQSCLHQGLAMVEILVDLDVDVDTLSAAVVYASIQYTSLDEDKIDNQLTASIIKIVQGAKKMDTLHNLHANTSKKAQLTETIDNFRKMLLAMVDDVRVVLVKLAEQLYTLHHLDHFNSEEQLRIAKECLDIYASLANRLGVGHLKWQIEDMAFRYINPKAYKSISKSLNQRRTERELYVKQMISLLDKAMKKAGVKDASIMGRAKHIYSIYRKMQRKKVDIKEIYDAIAVRILVDTVEDCYAVLGYVHSVWQPIAKEFDDYVANPKPNGYRSIHTAIIGPKDHCVEIQIRTNGMHAESELGVAAHWAYKEGTKKRSSYEDKILWLRQLMDWQEEVTNTEIASEKVQAEILDDRVYVFTPNGDIVDLPQGSTPLDFAYHIHTEVGHRCRGAKTAGHLVPLTYKLKTGDRLEILTAKNAQPSRDWLNVHAGYLKTSRARSKVQNWFRQQDYDVNLAKGREILEKELKRLHLSNVDYLKVAQAMNYKTTEGLFAGLGQGDINLHAVMNKIQAELGGEKETAVDEISSFMGKMAKRSKPSADIVIDGVGGLLTNIAKCCKPVPGDSIVGYITVGRGISIHRKDCPNLLQASQAKQARLVTVSWGDLTCDKYAVDLIIYAYDRQGLARDITQLLANENINMTGLNCTMDKKNNTAQLLVAVEIDSLDLLSRLLSKIDQLPHVFDVKRLE